MNRGGDGRRSDGPNRSAWDEVELLDLESEVDLLPSPRPLRPPVTLGPSGPSGPRWTAAALAAAVVAVAVIVLASRSGGHRTPLAAPTSPAASTTARFRPVPPPAASTPSPRAVEVTDLHRALAPVPVGWDLFARGPSVMVRIELARGRITRTAVPPLSSSGPVSFVVGADRAIVQPVDLVPGYVIPDGHRPALLADLPLEGGYYFPGPDSHHVWRTSDKPDRMQVADLDGHLVDAKGVDVPAYTAEADGTGYLVFSDLSGAYRAGPHGVRRVTTGALVAVGPTRWLVSECDARHHCHTTVIDRTTGHRRVLGPRWEPYGPVGRISPDGTIAAFVKTNPGQTSRLHLLDLISGRQRVVDLELPEEPHSSALVWSPDSRQVFVLDDQDRLAVVDRAAQVHRLPARLPRLTQLAFRVR